MKKSHAESEKTTPVEIDGNFLSSLISKYLSESLMLPVPHGKRWFVESQQSSLVMYNSLDLNDPNIVLNLCATLDNMPDVMKAQTSHILDAAAKVLSSRAILVFDEETGVLDIEDFKLPPIPAEYKLLFSALATFPRGELVSAEAIAEKMSGTSKITFDQKSKLVHDLAMLKHHLATIKMSPNSELPLTILELQDGPLSVEENGKVADSWGFSLNSDFSFQVWPVL